ncbi:hypothetical protein K9M79_08565 [Candidatus Woesearchaeota archaeon]|nr:hypothetical protein [Candidatus Woesearchaeota archaeon]
MVYKKGLLIISFILIFASLVFSSMYYEYYYNDFSNIGGYIYKPGDVTFSYNYYSSSEPFFTVELFKLSADEIADYESRSNFDNRIAKYELRAKGKLYRNFVTSRYDPNKKKHIREYSWETEYKLSGEITENLDEGIYVFRYKGTNSLYVVSNLQLYSKLSNDKTYFMVMNSLTDELVDCSMEVYNEDAYGKNTLVDVLNLKNGFGMTNAEADMLIVKYDSGLFVVNNFPDRNHRNYYDYSHNVETYTDRPVYRPNQTVYFKSILWEVDGEGKDLLSNYNIDLTVYDNRGDKVHEGSYRSDMYGAIYGSFMLDEDANIGDYRFDYDGNFYDDFNFKVEEYRKPEFKIDIESDRDVFIFGSPVELKVNASYYFGEPVRNADVSYEVYRSYYHRPCWGYFDCMYGRYDYYYGYGATGELIYENSTTTDTEGFAYLKFDPVIPEDRDQPMKYYFTVKATDESRKEVEKTETVTVAPGLFKIDSHFEKYTYSTGDGAKAVFSVQDYFGHPINTSLEVVVFREDSLSFKEQISSQDVEITDGSGYIRFVPEKGGTFSVLAVGYDEEGNKISDEISVRIYGKDSGYRPGKLEIITDAPYYFEGDTANVFIEVPQSEFEGFFTVEGMDIYRVIPVSGRDSEIESIVKLKVPIGNYSPNVFFRFFYIDNGTIYSANKEIFVPARNKMLNISIDTGGNVFQINDDVHYDIEVKDGYGNPQVASLSLGVVDEPIYDIYPDNSPDLFQVFNEDFENIVRSYKTRFYYENQYDESISIWLFIIFGSLGLAGLLLIAGCVYTSLKIKKGWMRKVGFIVLSIFGLSLAVLLFTLLINWLWIEWDFFELVYGVTGGVLGLHIPLLVICGLTGIIWFCIDKFRLPVMVSIFGILGVIAIVCVVAFAFLLFGIVGFSKSTGFMGAVDDMAYSNMERSMDMPMMSESQAVKGGESQPEPAEAKIRKFFPDTLYWNPAIVTDELGKAQVDLTLPDSLTTFRATILGYTDDFKAGNAIHKILTTKGIIVRLQTPRTFSQSDEVVVSGNVHNYLDHSKDVIVRLETDDNVKIIGLTEQTIRVESGEDKRVDFRVKVNGCCNSLLTIYALTDEESDAMQLDIPIIPKGVAEHDYDGGKVEGVYSKDYAIPYRIDTQASNFTLFLSPTLAKSALESLEYLTGFPHGCAEQTMNKFLPDLIVLDTIENLGLKEENLQYRLPSLVSAGRARLYELQHSDGGWGWWKNDRSSVYMSAYVSYGLIRAKQLGFDINQQRLTNGLSYVSSFINDERDHNKQAYAYYVLSLEQPIDIPKIYFDFALNDYGKALLAMALYNNDDERYSKYTDDLIESAKCDERYCNWESGIYRWRYNDIESTSWALLALIRTGHHGDIIEKGINYLVKEKRGNKWHSTKDTAVALEAIMEYLVQSKELEPDYTLRVLQDGKIVEEARITGENVLNYDGVITLNALNYTNLKIEKEGTGNLYFSSAYEYYIESEEIKPANSGFEIARSYSKYNVDSGDEILVTLRIRTEQDFEYVHIEEYFPAGAEVVKDSQFDSEQQFGSSYHNVRDEKIDIFFNYLSKGERELTYKLRAEIPGKYTAVPARVNIMYSPEIFGHSGTTELQINDLT